MGRIIDLNYKINGTVSSDLNIIDSLVLNFLNTIQDIATPIVKCTSINDHRSTCDNKWFNADCIVVKGQTNQHCILLKIIRLIQIE